jgi:hypothetical protein
VRSCSATGQALFCLLLLLMAGVVCACSCLCVLQAAARALQDHKLEVLIKALFKDRAERKAECAALRQQLDAATKVGAPAAGMNAACLPTHVCMPPVSAGWLEGWLSNPHCACPPCALVSRRLLKLTRQR